jgi:hypothetical protein
MAGRGGTAMNREEMIERLKGFYRDAGREVPSVAPRWIPEDGPRRGWLQPVLASVALVAVAVGIAIGVRTVRDQAAQVKPSPTVSASPSTAPSPSASSTWVTRVPLGQVTAMTTDASAVFALYLPTPVSGAGNATQARVARIDRTRGVAATAGPFPGATQIARANGGLWVAGTDGGTPWLTLLDPQTLAVKHRTELPATVEPQTNPSAQLAGAADLLWIAYGRGLYRLEPSTGDTVLTRTLSGTATSISIDPSATRLYVGLDASAQPNGRAMIVEWDASTGTQLASTATGGAGLGGPQVAGSTDGVWVAYATGTMGAVEHRSASGLTLMADSGQPRPSHSNGIRVYVEGTSVWFVDRGAQEVVCGDAHSGAQGAVSQQTLPEVVVGDAAGTYLGDAAGVAPLRRDASCPR